MLLKKTDKARDALAQAGGASLNLQERRILILTDGKRSLNEVMSMLGQDILPAVDRLMKAGFITAVDPSPAVQAAAGERVNGFANLLRAAADAIQTRSTRPANGADSSTNATVDSERGQRIEPQPDKFPPTEQRASEPTTLHSARPRRSLAASKMYVLDILQLQRDVRMAEYRSEIQCAQG
jgi:hypothetical protein